MCIESDIWISSLGKLAWLNQTYFGSTPKTKDWFFTDHELNEGKYLEHWKDNKTKVLYNLYLANIQAKGKPVLQTDHSTNPTTIYSKMGEVRPHPGSVTNVKLLQTTGIRTTLVRVSNDW